MKKTPKKIQELIDAGALFFCNHSGGKDSQIMFIYLQKIIPKENLIVIHSHLPGVEWEGVIDHIKNTVGPDYLTTVVQAEKTFLGMVEKRGMFPSPKYRQCTSDLKRGPIEKEIRRISKLFKNKIIVNCMGLRAEESENRAKKKVFKKNKKNSVAGRSWFDWLPVHKMKRVHVFAGIENAGQKPHWAYSKGMSRLSCIFCIMASKSDLKIAAALNPGLVEEYTRIEKATGQTMFLTDKGPQTLKQMIQ
jgi:3'-phosphoadenosine 5'-phosphosulfate sulfotransferase (PAPS reductase)/FAD synthetase